MPRRHVVMTPSRRTRRLLRSGGPGHAVIRHLLPAAIGALTVLGFLRRRDAYGTVARRDVEAELRRSSRYFELSRDLVCTAGFDGYFKQLNSAWTETLGWSEDELRARPFVEFVHDEDRARTEAQGAELAAGGVTVDFVNRYATKDGGWRWIEWSSMAIVEEELIYASARDVTQRRVIEAALERSDHRMRQIVETAHDAFISIDARGLITGWNPQAETSFGWSQRDALGRELAETIIPERDRAAHRRGLERFLATGEGPVLGRRLELTALHRDGREFPVELTISPIEMERGYTFNAFLRDITERKGAERELALARDEALEASRMKSMFVANVSHEIRTPMNGVIGMSELLLDTELNDAQREYAEAISASGEALLTIIDDILDFSKIEAGKLELDPTDFDLRDAIERACGMLAARAHEKGLELAVAIGPEVPALVHADCARLRQVLTNLVANAIKFTAEGEVVVQARAEPAGDGEALVRVEVSDTGIGIERDALDQLFEPYAQADGSTTRKYGGTGLGLAISRQLIELMGGRVGAESEPGKGSSFWFELAMPHAEASEHAPREEPSLAGLRVLVVDDNATSRRILERQLSSWQMSCEVADGAARAMGLLQSAAAAGIPFALGLLDLNMPGVDGFELAAAIRATPALRGMRLVLMSSSGAPEDAALDGALVKPVRQSRLYEEIQAVMAGEHAVAARLRAPASADAPRRGPIPAILVVEDTLINQAVAAHMLARCGFEAQVAENGRTALEALSKRTYAAVLMDCQMPELDGYETTREIRRLEQGGRRMPVIAMTANAMQGERERCLAAGMDDYLTKPLRQRTLKDTLARWVAEAPETAEDPDPAAAADGGRRDDGGSPRLLDDAVISDLENLDGDALNGLVALYFDEAAGHLSDLGGAVDRGDMALVAQMAHALRGNSSTLGAARVAHIAAELETTANAGDLSPAAGLLDTLRGALDDTGTAFRGRVTEPNNDGVFPL
ncbi:MAG TPA: PAS domain S-box protein [Solirubrobacteraceae bacterium]|nr:PAS domain S-box protein [Solirubrobacteraceae bacterium]